MGLSLRCFFSRSSNCLIPAGNPSAPPPLCEKILIGAQVSSKLTDWYLERRFCVFATIYRYGSNLGLVTNIMFSAFIWPFFHLIRESFRIQKWSLFSQFCVLCEIFFQILEKNPICKGKCSFPKMPNKITDINSFSFPFSLNLTYKIWLRKASFNFNK